MAARKFIGKIQTFNGLIVAGSVIADYVNGPDLVNASGGGTVNFLRADGAWAVPPGSASGLTVNTTTVSGGAAGRLLWDDGAVVQETVRITYLSGTLVLVITAGSAAQTPLVLRSSSVAAGAGDILSIQNDSLAVLAKFDYNGYLSAGAVTITTLGLSITTAGQGISIKTGSNCKMGTATLAGGTVTVNTTAVTASSKIFLSFASTPAANAAIGVGTITAGVSFTINSTNLLGGEDVNWLILEPA